MRKKANPNARENERNRFEECLKFVLKWEGGWSPPQPGDPNPTMKGITQAEYDSYRKSKGLPTRSVREIEDEEVREIYYNNYWKKVKADKLPPPLDLVVFDTAVNCGVFRAAVLLQEALNSLSARVKIDGVIGPQTLEAVNKIYEGKILWNLIRVYLDLRKNFYKRLALIKKEKARFLKGWLNRLSDLEVVVREFLRKV